MARFGLLMLNRGVWDTTAILSDTSYFRSITATSQDLNKSYGYLCWLNGKTSYMIPQTQMVFPGPLCPDAPADMFAALGKNGRLINMVPSLDLVFIRMGDAPGDVAVPFMLNNEIWERLNQVIGRNTALRAPGNAFLP
jgi:CubicO group peptidase (beta-lactamase class C family)